MSKQYEGATLKSQNAAEEFLRRIPWIFSTWIKPHITVQDGEVVFEWWKEDRSLTLIFEMQDHDLEGNYLLRTWDKGLGSSSNWFNYEHEFFLDWAWFITGKDL